MTAEELRALDVEIHRKVMGEDCYQRPETGEWCQIVEWMRDFNGNPIAVAIPEYTTNIRDAFLVLEKIGNRIELWNIWYDPTQTKGVVWFNAGGPGLGRQIEAEFDKLDELPLAICRCALQVIDPQEIRPMANQELDEADRLALAALAELEKNGIQPLDDQGWMNPEDKYAVCAPFAAAIRTAVAAERERIRLLAEEKEATYEEREANPDTLIGGWVVGIYNFADLLSEALK